MARRYSTESDDTSRSSSADDDDDNMPRIAGLRIRGPSFSEKRPYSNHGIYHSQRGRRHQGNPWRYVVPEPGSYNQDQGHRSRRKPMEKVTFPTGDAHWIITSPKPCRCRTRASTKLIPLKADGVMSGKEYKIVAHQMNSTIQQHNSVYSKTFTKFEIISIEKVNNCCLWKRYNNTRIEIGKDVAKLDRKVVTNEKIFFHGTVTTDDILENGFDERHSNKDGYFGAGIYFAKHSSKSNQYVFGKNGCPLHANKCCFQCPRKMLLCRVILGRSFKQEKPEKRANPPPTYHSMVGVPSPNYLKFHEYVVYKGEQAYPEYVVTYKMVE